MSKGFTIIELVVSILVLTVAVIGAYNAFSIMMTSTSQMSDRLTAAYLAQEGIEVVRNMRDKNWLNEKDWLDEINTCENGCWLDYKTGTSSSARTLAQSQWTESDWQWLFKDTSGFYSYEGGERTNFARKITITPLTNDAGEFYAVKVEAKVYWKEKRTVANMDFFGKGQTSRIESIIAEDYLYNWY